MQNIQKPAAVNPVAGRPLSSSWVGALAAAARSKLHLLASTAKTVDGRAGNLSVITLTSRGGSVLNRNHRLSVLAASRFATAYEWTSSRCGNVEAVVFAAFNHPTAGRIDAYAKFYPHSGRGFINEITGWLLANACGLPVPEHAFIALIPLSALPKPIPSVLALARKEGRQHYPAFCTSNAVPTEVQPLVNTPELLDEMRRWKHVHGCVAFDERVANTDRHLGNLVRRGLRDFVAIDHGRLAWRRDVGEWTSESISDPLAEFENRLTEFLWSSKQDKADGNAVLAEVERMSNGVDQVQDELEHWWKLYVSDAIERNNWKSFLASRLENLESLLKRRFELLI